MCTSEAKGFRRLFMKKKLLYVIMSLVFALALCGGSVAVLTTSDALARLNGGENVAAGETTTEGENIVVEGSSEGEDITVSASVTAANIQASQRRRLKLRLLQELLIFRFYEHIRQRAV